MTWTLILLRAGSWACSKEGREGGKKEKGGREEGEDGQIVDYSNV